MTKANMIVGIVCFTLIQGVQAQTPKPLSGCERAEMIVNGAVSAYRAKQHGVPYEQQVKAVQSVADKLVGTLGSGAAKSYSDTEIKILQSLYNGPEYSSMSPGQFKDAMNAAFYSGAGCPQPMSI